MTANLGQTLPPREEAGLETWSWPGHIGLLRAVLSMMGHYVKQESCLSKKPASFATFPKIFDILGTPIIALL